MLEQLVTSCSVLSEEIRWLFETRPALMPCNKTSSRLERLEVMSRRNGGHVVEGDSRRLEEGRTVVKERYGAKSVLETTA